LSAPNGIAGTASSAAQTQLNLGESLELCVLEEKEKKRQRMGGDGRGGEGRA